MVVVRLNGDLQYAIDICYEYSARPCCLLYRVSNKEINNLHVRTNIGSYLEKDYKEGIYIVSGVHIFMDKYHKYVPARPIGRVLYNCDYEKNIKDILAAAYPYKVIVTTENTDVDVLYGKLAIIREMNAHAGK
jgi:hypothetical protein